MPDNAHRTGGAGKTRLALEVADTLQEVFNDAVWFVPLADIADASSLPDAILKALNLPRTNRRRSKSSWGIWRLNRHCWCWITSNI